MGSSQSSSLASVLLRYGVVVIVGMRQGRSNLSLIWSSSLSALSRCGISLRSHCRCHCPLSSEQDEQTLLKVAQEEHVLSTQCSHFGSTILCIASSAWLVVMTSAEAMEQIRTFSHTSGALSSRQIWEIGVTTEAIKQALRQAADDFVKDSGGMPILTSKSCDGTPVRVTSRSSHQLSEQTTVHGSGKKGVEFLVKNQFYRLHHAVEGWLTKAVLSEATPLLHGKGTAAILAACFKDWMSLRQHGHSGICVEHYIWDRLSTIAFERLCRQWHLEQPVSAFADGTSAQLARQSEWVIVTPCALHDSHNSFKWGLMEE